MSWHGVRPQRGSAIAAALAAVTVVACSPGGDGSQAQPSPGRLEQVVAAPRGLLAASQPQPNGTIWTLAGDLASKGLYELGLPSGKEVGSLSVSGAAESVAESLSGVVGLALGTRKTGALELLDGSTGRVARTVPLGAPARDVVVGSDGSTFYVLNGTAKSSSVTVVDSKTGGVLGTVPVPLDAVSVVPDVQGSTLYVLQPGGQVSQIEVAGGRITSAFPAGGRARSVAISPDGTTLYVLKGSGGDANVAEVNLATESVQRVIPAPANARQVLVSADGRRIYQAVGTGSYGNIQVFGN